MLANTVGDPGAVVVEAQHAAFAHLAVVRAVGLERGAHLAEAVFLG